MDTFVFMKQKSNTGNFPYDSHFKRVFENTYVSYLIPVKHNGSFSIGLCNMLLLVYIGSGGLFFYFLETLED